MSVPSRQRSAEDQARVEADIRDLFERRITFNQILGLHCESSNPASPRIRFDLVVNSTSVGVASAIKASWRDSRLSS